VTIPTVVTAVAHGSPNCYLRGCRRPECTSAAVARSRMTRYMRQTGRGTLCPPGAAARHIDRLRKAGMPDAEIKRQAGIADATLYRIVSNTADIRRSTERNVLSVAVPVAAGASNLSSVDAVGARRRIQAMALAGWPEAVMAERMGLPKMTVWRILHHRSDRVSRRTMTLICGFFAEVWDRKPEDCGVSVVSAKRARLRAEGRGWHPIAVWERIDDPEDEPNYGEHEARVHAVVEDTAELIREGLSPEGISMRLGIEWDSIRRAHLRAGVRVPEVAA